MSEGYLSAAKATTLEAFLLDATSNGFINTFQTQAAIDGTTSFANHLHNLVVTENPLVTKASTGDGDGLGIDPIILIVVGVLLALCACGIGMGMGACSRVENTGEDGADQVGATTGLPSPKEKEQGVFVDAVPSKVCL